MTFNYFGYGSLVNAATRHPGSQAQKATLKNWVREWRQCIRTPHGNICSLTITPRSGSNIDGVIACDKLSSLAALDAREIGYVRATFTADDFTPESATDSGSALPESVLYYQSLPAHYHPASVEYPILQSYIDCVMQGFLHSYGETGVQRFVTSTEGWDSPILNDREAPLYPRAIQLSDRERELIDALLAPVISKL